MNTFRTRPGIIALAAVLMLGGAAACDDSEEITILEPIEDVVVTVRDTDFNFNTVRTFSIPDSIVHLQPATGGTMLALSRAHDDEILEAVRQNLFARGYQENLDPRRVPSDVIVLVGATATQEYAALATYPWWNVWGWYEGWDEDMDFDATWSFDYPNVAVIEVDVGTIIVDMIANLQVNPLSREIPSVWIGAAQGILDGTSNVNRVVDAIDEMFRQSPYLLASPVLPGAR